MHPHSRLRRRRFTRTATGFAVVVLSQTTLKQRESSWRCCRHLSNSVTTTILHTRIHTAMKFDARDDRYLAAAQVIACLTVLVILVYMCVKNKEVNIGGIVDRAAQEAAFDGAVFIIHDKSSDTVCNRLIKVRPFDWMIWACRGELYILNPEGGVQCSAAGQTPAVRVYADHFVETCLTLSYNTIISSYSKHNGARIKHVPYEIEGTTFTILAALNILVKDWITFDTTDVVDPAAATLLRDIEIEQSGVGGGGGNRSKRSAKQIVGLRRRTKNYLTTCELKNVFKHLARRDNFHTTTTTTI